MKDQTADAVLICIKKCFTDQYYDLGYLPRRLHSDKGRNYLSELVQSYLRDNHVKFTDSVAYNHQQNGLAEKTHLDLTNMTNSLLNAHKMPKRVWSVAMNHSTYLNNRLHHASIGQTPYEYYYNKKSDLSNLREFGPKILVHVPKRRDKLSPKAKEMIFSGFTDSSVNYLIMDPGCNYVTDATSVYFIDQPPNKPKDRLNLVTVNLPPSDSGSTSSEIDDEDENDQSEDEYEDTAPFEQIDAQYTYDINEQSNFTPDFNLMYLV